MQCLWKHHLEVKGEKNVTEFESNGENEGSDSTIEDQDKMV